MTGIKVYYIRGVSAPWWDWVKVDSLQVAANSSFVAGLQQAFVFQPVIWKTVFQALLAVNFT